MPSDEEVNLMFAEASQDFLDLYKSAGISPKDIAGRTWKERYVIALELWCKCDSSVQRALIGDQHEAVRTIAKKQFNSGKIQNWTATAITSKGETHACETRV